MTRVKVLRGFCLTTGQDVEIDDEIVIADSLARVLIQQGKVVSLDPDKPSGTLTQYWAVDWVDPTFDPNSPGNNSLEYSAGPVDLSGPPFNGDAEVGQSILAASPSNAADSGVWIIDSIDEMYMAVCSRREDFALGTRVFHGELIGKYSTNAIGKQLFQVIEVDDEAQDPITVDSAVLDGQNVSLFWRPLNSGPFAFDDGSIQRAVVTALIRKTLTFDEVGPSDLLPAQHVAYCDATDNNVTVRLPEQSTIAANCSSGQVVKRIDSSGNTVTIGVATGEFLDGVENGTTTLSALAAARFECDGNGKWWKC